ncbi:uncharacterized protein A4U43_C07F29260 [Asparagus officinalis]|uniref:Subtilisin-like protease fibronectin type-III domain-containing protein n=1 Tax=Asparagus officinalis TaxID=4686 RepID=A0A5P1EFQ5_ASPOF|nr:uncharacterized protein A4U43_C07F29260 [Asparagus officinalis]
MSRCPHLSGLAALLKGSGTPALAVALRRSRSVASIHTRVIRHLRRRQRSLSNLQTRCKPATPFDYGAGHVDPPKALDPGLVYDLTATDYLDFLCALNYTSVQIGAMAKGSNFTCSSRGAHSVSDLNYPSFSVPFATASGMGGDGTTSTITHTRTLTNVGPAGTYKAKVSTSADGDKVKIVVNPTELSFSKEGEKKSYTVSFTSPSMPSGSSGFGRLEWDDGKHVVASPIAFTWT